VKADLAHADSIYGYYKRLIELRKHNPVMVYGEYEDLSEGDPNLYVYTRELDGEVWLIALNHKDGESQYELPERLAHGQKELVIANYPNAGEDGDSSLKLRPHEARIYRLL
jgi:oligo-1,6-glucosidase